MPGPEKTPTIFEVPETEEAIEQQIRNSSLGYVAPESPEIQQIRNNLRQKNTFIGLGQKMLQGASGQDTLF